MRAVVPKSERYVASRRAFAVSFATNWYISTVNRYHLLHATTDLAVNRFDHPPHEIHCDPEREVASRWAIAFVQRGSFSVEARGVRRVLSPGSAFLVYPGLEFRCQHDEACPTDVCLSVAFEDAAVVGLESAWTRSRWIAREVATPRLAYVDRRLSVAANANSSAHSAEAMERWAIDALSALMADAPPERGRGRYGARASELDAVVATCTNIEADPQSRRSLADRARDVGCTSTRLTHAFRRYVGMAPHQFVVRTRLAHATVLLDAGVSVSDACYRSGFENLSHFCRLFQRHLGLRASAWKRHATHETRRKVQDPRARTT